MAKKRKTRHRRETLCRHCRINKLVHREAYICYMCVHMYMCSHKIWRHRLPVCIFSRWDHSDTMVFCFLTICLLSHCGKIIMMWYFNDSKFVYNCFDEEFAEIESLFDVDVSDGRFSGLIHILYNTIGLMHCAVLRCWSPHNGVHEYKFINLQFTSLLSATMDAFMLIWYMMSFNFFASLGFLCAYKFIKHWKTETSTEVFMMQMIQYNNHNLSCW